MSNMIRLYAMYVRRCLKDSFTIGYSVIFPLIMIGLLGFIRRGSFSSGFTSFQYYTLTMLPFCICCELITAAYQGQEEGRLKVAERFLIAPISTWCIIVAKWSAGVTALSICHGVVYLLSKLIFHVSYGGKGGIIYFLSIEVTALIYGFGLMLGLGMKNFVKFKSLVNLPILAFAVLGGSFYPFGSFDPFVVSLIKLSPLTWINRAMFLSMYDDDFGLLLYVILITCIGGIGILYLAIRSFKKEGYLYGESFHTNQ